MWPTKENHRAFRIMVKRTKMWPTKENHRAFRIMVKRAKNGERVVNQENIFIANRELKEGDVVSSEDLREVEQNELEKRFGPGPELLSRSRRITKMKPCDKDRKRQAFIKLINGQLDLLSMSNLAILHGQLAGLMLDDMNARGEPDDGLEEGVTPPPEKMYRSPLDL